MEAWQIYLLTVQNYNIQDTMSIRPKKQQNITK